MKVVTSMHKHYWIVQLAFACSPLHPIAEIYLLYKLIKENDNLKSFAIIIFLFFVFSCNKVSLIVIFYTQLLSNGSFQTIILAYDNDSVFCYNELLQHVWWTIL